MSESKYKSPPGYKVVRANGNSESGLMNGNSPAITHSTETINDGYITKTETIVEYSRVPMANTRGNDSRSVAPVGTNGNHSEAILPHKTGPVSNLRWWYKPKSNDSAGTYEHDKRNKTGIDKGNKMSQQYFDISRKETAETHIPTTMSISSGWAKSKVFDKEARLKGISIATPTIDEAILAAATQGLVTPYAVVSNGELLLPTIDSREAARRYGGVATSSTQGYAPAIGSKEATW